MVVYESLFGFGSSYCELDMAFFSPPSVKILITNIDWTDVSFSDTAPRLAESQGVLSS